MAAPKKKASKSEGTVLRMHIKGSKASTRKVSFGDVTVTVTDLDAAIGARNIKRGQVALERASKALATPGITMTLKRGVPYYQADPSDPRRVIRVLNGKRTYGKFHGGVFKTMAK